MVTRSGANQYRGTANYQYWTNKINELNPSQRLTFTPPGKESMKRDVRTTWR